MPPGFAANGVNGQEMNYGIDPDIINLYGADADQEFAEVPLDDFDHHRLGQLVQSADRHLCQRREPRHFLGAAGNSGADQPEDGGFEVNVGLRIRGGYSRNDFNPKHAFRFYFRSEYGDSKLNYELFGDEGAGEFDVLDLRPSRITPGLAAATCRTRWFARCSAGIRRQTWATQYTRSRYHHLYINGVYWGVFQTQERVEEFYSETYFGGDADDYDIVKSGLADVGGTEISEGNDIAWRQLFDYGQAVAANPMANANLYWTMQGLNPDGTRNPALPVLLDAEQLADYMLIIFYTGGFDTGTLAVHRRQCGQQLVRHLQPRGGRRGLPVLHPRQRAFARLRRRQRDTGRRTSIAPVHSTTATRTTTRRSIHSICTRICWLTRSTGNCSSTGCRNSCSTAAR